MANNYNLAFKDVDKILTPKVHESSSHVYHQYTLRILNGKRDELKSYLNDFGIPSMIYYPIPIHNTKPYSNNQILQNTDFLSDEVISLPIHTELENSNQDYIIENVIKFLNENKKYLLYRCRVCWWTNNVNYCSEKSKN